MKINSYFSSLKCSLPLYSVEHAQRVCHAFGDGDRKDRDHPACIIHRVANFELNDKDNVGMLSLCDPLSTQYFLFSLNRWHPGLSNNSAVDEMSLQSAVASSARHVFPPPGSFVVESNPSKWLIFHLSVMSAILSNGQKSFYEYFTHLCVHQAE